MNKRIDDTNNNILISKDKMKAGMITMGVSFKTESITPTEDNNASKNHR